MAVMRAEIDTAIGRQDKADSRAGFANPILARSIERRIAGQGAGQRRRLGFVPIGGLDGRGPHYPEQAKNDQQA